MQRLRTVLSKELKDNAEVVLKENDIARSEIGTEAFEANYDCVVIVKNIDAITILLRIANSPGQFGVAPFVVNPISTGKNWGYGSSLHNTQNHPVVLLDLFQLNEVTFFDEENGVISLQPGVTQSALFEYLSSKQTSYMVPVTGAGPTTSILSNALERGYGITPIADHFTSVMSIKGFLADGSFYQSSLQCMSDMANGDNSECYVDKTFKWKHGPYLDGIFTQSGNMIVTEITL